MHGHVNIVYSRFSSHSKSTMYVSRVHLDVHFARNRISTINNHPIPSALVIHMERMRCSFISDTCEIHSPLCCITYWLA